MPWQGDTGQYGLMPHSALARKFEITEMYEDPSAVESHWRDTVTDYRPDPATLASDQERYDFHSGERNALRHTGSRSGLDPYMPDQFLELTERDPRGTNPDLNLNATAIPQMYSRAKYINFYPDSDHSIQESQVTAGEMNYKIRSGFEASKKRLKIFSTSRGNYPAARNFKSFNQSRKSQTVNPEDCMVGDICEQEMYGIKTPLYEHKSPNDPISDDATFHLSNTKPIGSRITTDHEFTVANYGLVRHKQMSDNPYLNRNSAKKDSSEPTISKKLGVCNPTLTKTVNLIEKSIKKIRKAKKKAKKELKE